MKFSLAASIATLASLSMTTEAAISRHFKLKTQVINGMQGFNNQYIVTYHTGAGENVPTLTKNATIANVGYINGTTANFAYGSNGFAYLALGPPEDLEARWAPLTMNVSTLTGSQTSDPTANGYSIGSAGYFTKVKGGASQFNGWMVCNWVHGVPELFYDTPEGTGSDLPTSCASVYLVPVYV